MVSLCAACEMAPDTFFGSVQFVLVLSFHNLYRRRTCFLQPSERERLNQTFVVV